MKEITNNPDFVYELSCDQMCGKGHYSMRGVITVVSEEAYNFWLAQQKPEIWTVRPETAPKPAGAPAVTDSTAAAKTATPVAAVMGTK